MAGARFLYLGSQQEPADGGSVEPGQAACSWRLMGANNRPVGQAPSTVADLATCVAAVQQIVRVALVADLRMLIDLTTGLWNWRLESDGAVLAVSARAYQRQRECRYSVDTFRLVVATATAVPQLVLVPRRRFAEPLDQVAVDVVAPRVSGVHLAVAAR